MKRLDYKNGLAIALLVLAGGVAGCASDQRGDDGSIVPRNRAYRDDDMNSGASKNVNDIDLNKNAGDGYNPDRVGYSNSGMPR